MSAANASSPAASRQEEVRSTEPSMEEILASIRRIIADDEPPAARREERRRWSENPEPILTIPTADDALSSASERREPLLTTLVDRSESAPIAEIRPFRLATRDEPFSPPVDESSDDEAETPAEAEPVALSPVSDQAASPLMSPDAASAIASQFEALATTMMINESGILREYAQEMMRPMLKQWLDDNLPVIVERLVRAEIERVARGGRR